ncbi:MAG: class II fumarate hydratase [Xanthomonadales bacterium]|nr:class II fumarate hydratase [Xanthomonadales bacterium]
MKRSASAQRSRRVHDSMGALDVPGHALWGAQTQRAVDNFAISGQRMPLVFIHAVAHIKASAAHAHASLGLLDAGIGAAIVAAADAIVAGEHDDQFPVDVFQTGSGTSTNMNVNEVIATLASRGATAVHANDHVNIGQSSNDVIPSAIQVSAAVQLKVDLLPSLRALRRSIDSKARRLRRSIKTGRTHLMDAMPLTLAQELSGWSAQLDAAEQRFADGMPRLCALPLGGSAIGTGVNVDPRYPKRAIAGLSKRTGLRFRQADNLFYGIATQDAAVELSGHLNSLAVALMKIANDLRWMNSGPLAGLGEIELPALQPGSSIMPGKVNPVIPEAVCMVCAQVMGQHTATSLAGQSGSFQLNTMLPLVANGILQSIAWLAAAMRRLAERAMEGFRVRDDVLERALARNPILVTALNPVIGYEAAARIAKTAYAEGRPVLEVARAMTDLDEATLRRLLDPAGLV